MRMPRGRTAYLSELKTGEEVLVCDAAGRERTAIVGRVKIEARPLVSLMGAWHSIAVCADWPRAARGDYRRLGKQAGGLTVKCTWG